jgi:hypothetical protein
MRDRQGRRCREMMMWMRTLLLIFMLRRRYFRFSVPRDQKYDDVASDSIILIVEE